MDVSPLISDRVVFGSSLPITCHPGSIETQVPAGGELGKPRWAIVTPSTTTKKVVSMFYDIDFGHSALVGMY